MLIARIFAWMLSVLMILFGISGVSGQDYPNKAIRIITNGTGGGNEFIARLIAQGISGPLGQPVIVYGRGVVVASEAVAKATPDGYTLLVTGQTHWISPLLQEVPYDPIRDYSPITCTDRSPSILVVHPSLAVNSVKELIALAKAKPGQLNYPTAGIGTATHLSTELFKYMAGISIVHVPYQKQELAISDLLSGRMHLRLGGGPSVWPHVKSGRLMALGVSSAQPSPLFPELPTIAASGLPGYEAASINGISAPAKMPVAIINRLNQEIVRFLRTPDSKERLIASGSEAVGSSPEELAAYVKADMAKFGKVIKDAGIKAN